MEELKKLKELKELKSQEIMEYLLPDLATLFGMELRGEEVVLLHGRTERVNVFGDGSRVFADRHIEAVNEIDKWLPFQ